jgi:hypothetical protein
MSFVGGCLLRPSEYLGLAEGRNALHCGWQCYG